jgi:periplasmic divalent cation tolerance protein
LIALAIAFQLLSNLFVILSAAKDPLLHIRQNHTALHHRQAASQCARSLPAVMHASAATAAKCHTDAGRTAMLQSNPEIRIILTTVGSREEAARIGRTLVEERLAACATSLPGVESIYNWHGQIESDTETLLLLKTEADRLEALHARLLTLHSYETPEVLVLSVEAASRGYHEWLKTSLAGAAT